jgi:hypothetical protein
VLTDISKPTARKFISSSVFPRLAAVASYRRGLKRLSNGPFSQRMAIIALLISILEQACGRRRTVPRAGINVMHEETPPCRRKRGSWPNRLNGPQEGLFPPRRLV